MKYAVMIGVACMLSVGADAPASAQNLTIEQRRDMAIQSIAIGGDEYLVRDRRVCARQKMHLVKQDTEAQGTPFPQPEDFCLAVLAESAKRDQFNALYETIAPPGVRDFFAYTFRASLAGKQKVPEADNMPLPCSLAFDVGFFYGVLKPDANNKSPNGYNDFGMLARDCYQPSRRVSSYNGLIAGVHFGQAWARKHTN